jgi:hypothetical protein
MRPMRVQSEHRASRHCYTSLSILAVFLSSMATGCGGKSLPATPPVIYNVSILTQPQSQTVPIDRGYSFNVEATGTPPLAYQWTKNGVAIAGAIMPFYAVDSVQAGDSGSTYRVDVSNTSSSLLSDAAVLTASARAPALGDLRYLLWQQITGPSANGGAAISLGSLLSSVLVTDSLGAPLTIGSTYVAQDSCSWSSSVLFLAPSQVGLNMRYDAASISNQSFESALQALADMSTVITSIDPEPPCNLLGTSSIVDSTNAGFDYRLELVLPADLQITASADGAQSRIITAATFDSSSGKVALISYGWKTDTATAYESQTVISPASGIKGQATSLSQAGYFISAFGGNDSNGYVIIGMKVRGDSLPRAINTDLQVASSPVTPYTVIAHYTESTGTTTIYQQ